MNIGGRGDGARSSDLALRLVGEPAVDLVRRARSSRSRRLSYVMRLLRVSRLKMNWIGSWRTYCGRSSNHSRCAARRAGCSRRAACARPRTRRARPGRRPRARSATTSAIASSIASFVAEPIEKCAVCAASPSSTTLSWRQRSTFDGREAQPLGVVRQQLVAVEQLREELLQDRDALQVAVPGSGAADAKRSKPARRQTSSRISTMKVDSPSS